MCLGPTDTPRISSRGVKDEEERKKIKNQQKLESKHKRKQQQKFTVPLDAPTALNTKSPLAASGFLILQYVMPPAVVEAVRQTTEQAGSFYSFSQPATSKSVPVDAGRALTRLSAQWLQDNSAVRDWLLPLETFIAHNIHIGAVDQSSLQTLVTRVALAAPQLLHTDHPFKTGHQMASVIAPCSADISLIHCPMLWEKVKSGELQRLGKAHLQDLLHNVALQKIKVRVGQVIVFLGSWPHAGDTDGRNFRLFFSLGPSTCWSSEHAVHNVHDLNHAQSIELNRLQHQGAGGLTRDEDLVFPEPGAAVIVSKKRKRAPSTSPPGNTARASTTHQRVVTRRLKALSEQDPQRKDPAPGKGKDKL
jgi:hypothetical protein